MPRLTQHSFILALVEVAAGILCGVVVTVLWLRARRKLRGGSRYRAPEPEIRRTVLLGYALSGMGLLFGGDDLLAAINAYTSLSPIVHWALQAAGLLCTLVATWCFAKMFGGASKGSDSTRSE